MLKRLHVDALLVTSGLGPKFGGIGSAAQDMLDAMRTRWSVGVATVPPGSSRAARGARLYASLVACAARGPRIVLYEHRGLATLHAFVPAMRAVPYAIFLHGFEVWRPLSRAQRRVIEGAQGLLANSQTTVIETRKHNPWLPEVDIVHLCVDVPARARSEAPISPLLVLVGRTDASERFKGHDEILDAWPRIRGAVPDARFVAIGDGSDVSRLRRRVEQERLAGVEFTGFIDNDAKQRWLQQATAAFALGRVEGFGLANVEAVALGIPLIGLPGTVLEELFPDGAGVTYVRSLDPTDIAEATIALLQDRQRAAELGDLGRKHVLARYTPEHFRARLTATLHSVMQRTKEPPNP
jgi:phosphatidylinositol alpha-1,6-mannosyltransferase